MNDSWLDLLSFFHDSLLVAGLAGALLGPVGIFLHLRRTLFLGAALPQVAGFGFVLGAALGLPDWPVALLVLAAFVALLAWRPAGDRDGLTQEGAIGVGFAAAMAGTVLLTAFTSTETHGQELLLKGSVLAASCRDLQLLTRVAVPLVLLLLLFRRRLLVVSLDPEMARALGVGVQRYDLLLFAVTGVAITLTLQACGAMAVFGLLLLPGLGALALCRRVQSVFLTAAVLGALGGMGGVMLALSRDLPAGPAMIIVLMLLATACRLARRTG